MSAISICAHALLNTLFPSNGFTISYTLWSFWSFAAALACLWRSSHCPPAVRTHWRLAAASIFLIFFAAALEAPAEIFFKATPTAASIGDFFFFSAFVPVLLAIALPEEGVFVRSTFLLDCLQAAVCSYLAFTVLFGVFPFTGAPMQGVSYEQLEFIYLSEYLVIVLLSGLRFLLGTRTASERFFFRSLLLYTSLYGITSAIYNHYVGKYNLTNGLDALNEIPSATLAFAAILAPATAAEPSRTASRPILVRLIDNARPVFLSLAVIALSAIVARQHFAVAIGFIFGVFVLYGLRASMLQSSIQNSQAALERASKSLARIALLDALTGISNRRSFDERLAMEWDRAQHTGQPLSLLLIDIDHFKRVNDTYGHQIGDLCLRHTAQILRSTFDRPADLIARYGGEEFAILLPETDSFGAFSVAGTIRAALAKEAVPTSGFLCPITVSIGVSTWNADEHANPAFYPGELLRSADRALYRAKQNGRNRVEFSAMHSLTTSRDSLFPKKSASH